MGLVKNSYTSPALEKVVNTYILHHNYKTAEKKKKNPDPDLDHRFTYLRYKHKAESNGAAEYYD